MILKKLEAVDLYNKQALKTKVEKPYSLVLDDIVSPNPLPLQYLGSKTRISRWLVDNISKQLPEVSTFVDLFAGTGAVSIEASDQGYDVILNDIQPYSSAILKSIFITPKLGLTSVINDLNNLKKQAALLNGQRKFLSEYLDIESNFIKSFGNKKLNWVEYKKFCNSTPRLTENTELKSKNKRLKYFLFSWYYPNTYFGIKQCLEIDALRAYADNLDDDQKDHVLAAVISALSFAVSSTTHLAQFLKPNNLRQSEFLLKKRSKSIIDLVINRLENLQNYNTYKAQQVYNLDYLDALKKINKGRSVVVYVDPPYFKEHYSRYYHILDTFYLYDYPELTINPQTNKFTEGKYRQNRIISNFGLRSKVTEAFTKLLIECKKKNFAVAISYANTSLISKEEMKAIINKTGYKALSIKEKGLMHSAQGQPNNKIAQEYLFTIVPKDE